MYGIKSLRLVFEFVVNVDVSCTALEVIITAGLFLARSTSLGGPRRNEKATKRRVYADVLSYFRGAELGRKGGTCMQRSASSSFIWARVTFAI